MKSITKLTLAMLALALPLAFAQKSQAQGTAYNTPIDNTATLIFAVGTVTQPTVNASATTVYVDRKVNFTVNNVSGGLAGGYYGVIPGSAGSVASGGTNVMKFTVTNNGNDAAGFSLSAANLLNGAFTFLSTGATDNLDSSNVKIYVSNNGTDDLTLVTQQNVINTVPVDGTWYVYIIGDFATMPTVHDGDIAGIGLTAAAKQSGTNGATDYPAAGVTDTNNRFTVFATPASATSLSANGAYKITAPNLAVAKSGVTVWDPINGSTSPKNIPGAIIRYTVHIANTGSLSANLTQITDALNANLTFNSSLVSLTAGPGASPASENANPLKVVARSATNYYALGSGISQSGQNLTINYGLILPLVAATYQAGELKPTESVDASFDVTIN
jgi:uncharacterized repeat protein (TIGR01451 family)